MEKQTKNKQTKIEFFKTQNSVPCICNLRKKCQNTIIKTKIPFPETVSFIKHASSVPRFGLKKKKA